MVACFFGERDFVCGGDEGTTLRVTTIRVVNASDGFFQFGCVSSAVKSFCESFSVVCFSTILVFIYLINSCLWFVYVKWLNHLSC